MHILLTLNISNADDVAADSGVIFCRIITKQLSDSGHRVAVLGPQIAERQFVGIENLTYIHMPLLSTKYSARLHFNWFTTKDVIEHLYPDLLLLNQIELVTHFRALVSELGPPIPRIAAYCHYIPAKRNRNPDSSEEVDASLNHGGLGISMQLACIQGVCAADIVLVQSNYAREALLALASRYGIASLKDPIVAPPPRDPMFVRSHGLRPPPNRTVVYNHRLYEHYGTWDFLRLAKQLRTLIPYDLIFCDPMPNRSMGRDRLDPSVSAIKRYIASERLGIVIPGSDRVAYRLAMTSARVGFSSLQHHCVWSMSVVDSLGLGIPVIAPNHSAFPEMVPLDCLFISTEEAAERAATLLSDDMMWSRASETALYMTRTWTSESFCNILFAALGGVPTR